MPSGFGWGKCLARHKDELGSNSMDFNADGSTKITTRSRAHQQAQEGAAANPSSRDEASEQEEDTREDVEMADEDKAAGADALRSKKIDAKANPGGQVGKGAKPPMVHEDVMVAHTSTRTRNPVIRLTVKLLDTYQDINEKYYAKHNKRSQDQWDDQHGDYIIRAGDMVDGRYKIVKRPNGSSPLLGKGSFGQVVYAIDTKAKRGQPQDVALKIIKNHHHWHEQAKCEIALLRRFTEMKPVSKGGKQCDWVDYANVVRLMDDFVFRNHCCLVFELLPFTLYDLLKYSRFKGVSLQLVSKFAGHLLRALDSLRAHDVDVIHCDLKPENVMLVKHDDHRVKVIDFGSSCSSKKQPFTYIQSRFYRSPEVLLCSPYSHAIDVWSLGCILVEMHTGQPLFNGKNEAEQTWKISDVLGLPPDHMIRNAGSKSKVKNLFKQEDGNYVLNVNSKTLKGKTKNFSEIIRRPTPPPHTLEQQCMYAMFEEFIMSMLVYDPSKRVTPADALKHPFVANQGPLQPPSSGAGRGGDTDVEMSPRSTPREGKTHNKQDTTPREGKVDQASQTGSLSRSFGGAAAGAP